MKVLNVCIKVGIIGINGKYGKWLKDFFERMGHVVIGSDIGTEVTNRQIVEEADVVIFSVPIGKTVSVINEVAAFSQEGQLFLDITSIKSPAVTAMMRSEASVVGLHPMCAPPKLGQTLRGQVIVRCDVKGRLSDAWRTWIEDVLVATEARIKISTPEVHDRCMAIVQGLTHAVALIMASVIRVMHVDVTEVGGYVSPPYRISLAVIGRILSQNPVLYGEIQMGNLGIPDVLDALEHEVRHFKTVIVAKDTAQFMSDFKASKEYFGKEVENANEFFAGVLKFIADSAEKNTS